MGAQAGAVGMVARVVWAVWVARAREVYLWELCVLQA